MTAFLAMILSVVFLFQSTFVTLLKFQGAQSMVDEIMGQSVYSLLAKFDGRIQEEYGLYMLYQDGTCYEEILKQYIERNLAQDGFVNVSLDSLETKEEGFSSLQHLEQQIIEYGKYKIPLETMERFFKRISGLLDVLQGNSSSFQEAITIEQYDEEKEYDTSYYSNFDMRETAAERLQQLSEKEENGVVIAQAQFATLPSQILQSQSSLGWAQIVNMFKSFVSQEGSALERLEEYMKTLPFREIGTVLYEDYLINEYILDIFNSNTKTNASDRFFNNEVEYIIFGNRGEQSNILYAQVAILLLRFIFNTIFIYQQESFVTIADIAGYLVTVPVGFQGQPIVKHGILTAWSLLESWHDCDALLNGKNIPIYKTEGTWRYGFSYAESNVNKTISLQYQDYLRIFLLLVPREIRLARILDLIQLNESKNRTYFQILIAITTIEVHMVCIFDKKETWEIRKKGVFSYEKTAG